MAKKNKPIGARWDLFLYHVILFVGVHLLFVPLYGVVPLSDLGSVSYQEHVQENFLNKGVNVYNNSVINSLSAIWKTILMVHLLIETIETLFPRKKKDLTQGQEEEVSETSSSDKEERNSGRAWIYLITAGLLEIIWASALKMDMLAGPLIIVLIVSFDLLIKSVKRLGIGTSYAVFTGIGVVGMVVVDFVLFQEPLSLMKVLLVSLLLVCIIGLKISSKEE